MVSSMPSTKIEANHNTISRITDLDELARVLFPGNKQHQKVFLVIFVELKYAPGGLLPKLDFLCENHGFSKRVLEIVRAKMRRMGLIDHVSRMSKRFNYREGWVLSSRFSKSISRLSSLLQGFRRNRGVERERKDRDLHTYL
jgi:hypothetical protein